MMAISNSAPSSPLRKTIFVRRIVPQKSLLPPRPLPGSPRIFPARWRELAGRMPALPGRLFSGFTREVLRWGIPILFALGLGGGLPCLLGGTSPPADETPAARTRRAYREAQAAFLKSPDSLETGWGLGRACFDWAEFAQDPRQRAEIAQEGIAACRGALVKKWSLAPAHFYLGLNLGQLARTKSLGALKLVREMEDEFKAALELDPKFDHAGPDRTLGLLYKDAPGWPTSIGGRTKARQHLLKAVELSPSFPENRLCLLEAYLEWGERKSAQAGLAASEAVLAAARSSLTGPAWEGAWSDWDRRWTVIKTKASLPPRALESPKRKS